LILFDNFTHNVLYIRKKSVALPQCLLEMHTQPTDLLCIIPGGPESMTSAYFCLYLLNALTKYNNFWRTWTSVYVEYCSE